MKASLGCTRSICAGARMHSVSHTQRAGNQVKSVRCKVRENTVMQKSKIFSNPKKILTDDMTALHPSIPHTNSSSVLEISCNDVSSELAMKKFPHPLSMSSNKEVGAAVVCF